MPRIELWSPMLVSFYTSKVGGVKLQSIIVGGAKQARAEIVVRKDEAPKVGNKRLNTGPQRNEIVVSVNVPELDFAESFFERNVRVRAVGAAADIDVHHAVFAGVQIVGNAKRRREFDGPVARLEGAVAM